MGKGQPGPLRKRGRKEKWIVFSRAVGLVWGSCFALRERADGWERREEVGGLSARLGSAVWEDLGGIQHCGDEEQGRFGPLAQPVPLRRALPGQGRAGQG